MTTRSAVGALCHVLAFDDATGAASSTVIDLHDYGPPEGTILFIADAELTATIKFEHATASAGTYADLVTDAQLAATGAAVRALAVDVAKCRRYIKATWSGAGAVFAAIVVQPKYIPVL